MAGRACSHLNIFNTLLLDYRCTWTDALYMEDCGHDMGEDDFQ